MWANFKARIQNFLEKGESVQIVAPYGFGKTRFGKSLGGLFLDPNLLQSPQEMIDAVKNSPERKLIILDSFDAYLSPDYISLFKFLRALRDQHKYQLSYVFLTHQNIDPKYHEILGDLYPLISEHTEYLPALEPSEYDLFGFSPTPKQLKEITRLSGGIPILVKSCVLAMRENQTISAPPFLAEMLAESSNHPAYLKSSLIQDYLNSHPPLSASETRLYNLLLTRQGQTISKDQICQAVYPDAKNYSGISDHAIDQLIHRLRAKIKDKYTIHTHRGLGYKLTIPQ